MANLKAETFYFKYLRIQEKETRRKIQNIVLIACVTKQLVMYFTIGVYRFMLKLCKSHR